MPQPSTAFPVCFFPPGCKFASQPVPPLLNNEQAAAFLGHLYTPRPRKGKSKGKGNPKSAVRNFLKRKCNHGLKRARGGGFALTELLRFIEGEPDHAELLRLQREEYADGEVGS